MADDLYQHPVVLGNETSDLQASALSRIGDAVLKGAPAAAISGTLSIANTFLDYTGQDQISVENAIHSFDSATGDYYTEHKEAIDAVGFGVTSLVPGMIGVKALQLARGGQALGAVGRALNLAPSRKAVALEQALKEVGREGGTVRSLVSSAARRSQLGWEVADQALMGLAAEAAVLATMNDSPVFDNYSFGDFAWNTALGVTFAGGIGGVLGSMGAKGILKDASKKVQEASRAVDTVNSFDSIGLTKGTELLAFAESIAKLPSNADNISFTPRGSKTPIELPTSEALRNARERAVRVANDKLAIKFNDLAGGNATVGQAYFDFIKRGAEAAKIAGKNEDEVIGLISGYLNNVAKISHIDEIQFARDTRKFYVSANPAAPAEDAVEKWSGGAFTANRAKSTKNEGYMLKEGIDEGDLVIASLDELPENFIKDVWKNHDIDILRMPDGSMVVNPTSPMITRIRENPFQVRKFMDIETGTLMQETGITFGDLVSAKGVTHGDDWISAGRRSFKQAPSVASSLLSDMTDASARFGWASNKSVGDIMRITKGVIDVEDLPLMQRLAELEPNLPPSTLGKLQFRQGEDLFKLDELGVGLPDTLEASRLEILQKGLAEWNVETHGAVPDTRTLAAHLNTDVQWVEEAIARNFTLPQNAENQIGKVLATAEALKPKTIAVEWDLTPASKMMTPEAAYNMNMGPGHLMTKELTKEYQIAIRTRVNKSASASVLGKDYGLFVDLDNLSRDTSIEGAGATTWGASNAGYGERAKIAVQDTGAKVALVTQRRIDEKMEALAAFKNELALSPAAQNEFGVITTALRKNPGKFAFTNDGTSRIVTTDVLEYAKTAKVEIDEAIAAVQARSEHPVKYDIANSSVAEFLRASAEMTHLHSDQTATLRRATGLSASAGEYQTIYAPPIDTVRYPYHAIVKTKNQIGVATDAGMITAKSEEQLRQLANKVDRTKFDVHFKGNTADYFEAKGVYDYAETLSDARVNSELVRTGALADFFPETRFENVMTDWLSMHARQEEKLVREAVQVNSRQFFSEMNMLSATYRQESESVFGGFGTKAKKAVADPFMDYTKTALNISKQQEVPLLDSLNEFVDKVGMQAGDAIERAFRGARISHDYEAVNNVAERYGLGRPYKDVETYLVANERYPRNLVRSVIQKANAALATVTLRFDFANSLLNIISTPIMLGTEMSSIRNLAARDPKLVGALGELTSVQVPGQQFKVPSTMKLGISGINNFFGPEKQALMQRYRDIGAIKDVGQKYHEMLDSLTYDPIVGANKWAAAVDKGVEMASKMTGNTFAEEFTRFVSADVMRQLSDPLVAAGKLSIKEQNTYISSFVNRVQGNYVTSQRPLVFQGTTGGAVSLFQTYSFNVLQQLHRHIQAGDKKTLAVFAGLQSSIFGFNGLPFFDAINTHIIGSQMAGNSGHKDAYSVLPGFNKELGDWMLYGTASAFPLLSGSAPALYTRGDINPRNVTLIPVNPMDVPAVQASIRAATAVWNFGKSAVSGVDLSDAMLQGLEHQGLNRPLAGLAQVFQGRSTTSKGSLISSAAEMENTSFLGALKDRMIDYGGVSRLMGARPMDEAVALNNLYRQKTYDALDKQRLERLGSAVKSKLYANQSPTSEEMEDFMARYARTGGRIENFSSFMQRAYKDANVSIVNQAMTKVNSSTGRKMMDIMGGQMLGDYRNQLDDADSLGTAE